MKNEYIDNIVQWYDRAINKDIRMGRIWYKRSYELSIELSKKYNIDSKIVCYLIAGLSINASWNQNKIRTDNFLHLFSGGLEDPRDYIGNNVGLYSHIPKLIDIAKGNLSALKGRKVVVFAANIYRKGRINNPCIDRHALKISHGDDINCITDKRFRDSQSAYNLAASIINKRDNLRLFSSQLQAITWLTYRRSTMTINEFNDYGY
jgi:hypothetical protein